ncbi:MAG: hypothetical protein ABS960_00610 [Solibacillus isronensis]
MTIQEKRALDLLPNIYHDVGERSFGEMIPTGREFDISGLGYVPYGTEFLQFLSENRLWLVQYQKNMKAVAFLFERDTFELVNKFTFDSIPTVHPEGNTAEFIEARAVTVTDHELCFFSLGPDTGTGGLIANSALSITRITSGGGGRTTKVNIGAAQTAIENAFRPYAQSLGYDLRWIGGHLGKYSLKLENNGGSYTVRLNYFWDIDDIKSKPPLLIKASTVISGSGSFSGPTLSIIPVTVSNPENGFYIVTGFTNDFYWLDLVSTLNSFTTTGYYETRFYDFNHNLIRTVKRNNGNQSTSRPVLNPLNVSYPNSYHIRHTALDDTIFGYEIVHASAFYRYPYEGEGDPRSDKIRDLLIAIKDYSGNIEFIRIDALDFGGTRAGSGATGDLMLLGVDSHKNLYMQTGFGSGTPEFVQMFFKTDMSGNFIYITYGDDETDINFQDREEFRVYQLRNSYPDMYDGLGNRVRSLLTTFTRDTNWEMALIMVFDRNTGRLVGGVPGAIGNRYYQYRLPESDELPDEAWTPLSMYMKPNNKGRVDIFFICVTTNLMQTETPRQVLREFKLGQSVVDEGVMCNSTPLPATIRKMTT